MGNCISPDKNEKKPKEEKPQEPASPPAENIDKPKTPETSEQPLRIGVTTVNRAEIEEMDKALEVRLKQLRTEGHALIGQLSSSKKEAWDQFVKEYRQLWIVPRARKGGDQVVHFALPNQFGVIVRSEELLKESAIILVFYRGTWCPECDTYLRALQNALPQFKRMGAQLVAISAERPEAVRKAAERLGLEFQVLSDVGLKIATAMGLVYELPPLIHQIHLEDFHVDWDSHYGPRSSVTLEDGVPVEPPLLILTPTYVVAQDGIITYAYINPDWTHRAPITQIMNALGWI